MEKLNINGRPVSPEEPPYVIAEIGANHNGDMGLARKLVDVAKLCGADAAKFQSWSKNSLISKAEYARNTEYSDKKKHFGSLEEMVAAYQLTLEQHHELATYCQEKGIDFLSSCFSPQEVDLLDQLNVPAFKIASMDINHLTLLEHVASKGKPVILSTGMATLAEIERALYVLRANGSGDVALLHCISIYPPDYKDIHLRNIAMLQQTFAVPVGFSDHTFGTAVSLAAIALGACIIEKHFTLDKDMAGWDHAISADPHELAEIVREGRHIFNALGSFTRTVSRAEEEKKKKFRRCIVIKHAGKRGEVLTLADLDYKRPGTGIHPDEAQYVIGRQLVRDLEADTELHWSDLG
ncbi:MAG: N-acetylneuraminate synthase family protein [Anaerolinea sp.]|nr:N-acetylneuraminate synthase family protein [Anaerolinea sp.]